MSLSPLRYASWKAPAEDSQVLLWPTSAELIEQTRQTHARLATDETPLQKIPLSELRQRVRHYVGHTDDAAPLIATGHQTELYHAGVWVKNVVINEMAKHAGGQAYHLAVDTDEPKHLHLRWPGGFEPITDDPALVTAAWAGLVDAPTPGHIASLEQIVNEARESNGWNFTPSLQPFFAALRRLSLESPKLPTALVNAAHELDWSLGLRQHMLVVSPLWMSEPFLVFAHHIMASGEAFAAAYNAALADYREANGIKSPGRPMPDLNCSDDRCETPFWLDDLAENRRERAYLVRSGDRWVLRVRDAEFAFAPQDDGWTAAQRLQAFLRANQMRIAPRAIMLTTFFRLLLADHFVHGIGGGQYDQVTDRLIESFFKVEATPFAVATATLYFPQAVGRPRECLTCIVQEGHRLKHDLLGGRKRELVDQIASAPRNSDERSRLFVDMHHELTRAAQGNSALQDWELKLKESQERSREEKTLFDRELFYALQPRERLETLIARYASLF